jgi:hypothetical protein
VGVRRSTGLLAAIAGLGAVTVGLGLLLWSDRPQERRSPGGAAAGQPASEAVGEPLLSSGDDAAHPLPQPGRPGAAPLDLPEVATDDGPAGRGVLRLRATWGAGGEPAPGVTLLVTAWGEPDRDARTRAVRTDASGGAGFREVAAGFLTVDAPRGGRASAELPAEGLLDLEIAVSADLLVRGRVVDARGRPVVGASIWVSIRPDAARAPTGAPDVPGGTDARGPPASQAVDRTRGRIAARSGADGRFEVKGLSPGQGLVALDAAGTPSPLLVLEDDESHTLEVTLELGPPGATLDGRLVDSDGAPVPGEVVVVHPPAEARAPVIRLITDSEGRFLATGLPPGATRVESSTPAGASLARRLQLEAEETCEVTLTLPAPTSLSGTVLDDAGCPVAGARIWLEQGRTMHEDTTGADGAFALTAIGPGESVVTAWHAQVGVARTGLAIEESTAHAWTATLAEGPSLPGRLVYEDGTPGAGLLVEAVPRGGHPRLDARHAVVADAEGRFRVRHCVADVYRLLIGDARPVDKNLLASEYGAPAGAGEVLVTLPRPAHGEARAHGRLVADDGEVLARSELVLWQSGTREHVARLDAGTGAFRAGPVRAGEHRLLLRIGHAVHWPLASVTMLAGQDVDLGELPLPRGGALVVLPMWPGNEPRELALAVLATGADGAADPDGSGWIAGLEARPDGSLHADGLPSGDHRLILQSDPDAVPVCRRVRIDPGVESVVPVALGDDVPLRLWLRASGPAERWGYLTVRLLDEHSHALVSRRVRVQWPDATAERAERLVYGARIAPGAYRVRVVLERGTLLHAPLPSEEELLLDRELRVSGAAKDGVDLTVVVP